MDEIVVQASLALASLPAKCDPDPIIRQSLVNEADPDNNAGGGGDFSDARLKRDVVRLAQLRNGLDLYRYRYLWSDTVYVGVMAQEVALIRPDAIVRDVSGFLRVDYGKLGLRMLTWKQWRAAQVKKTAAVH